MSSRRHHWRLAHILRRVCFRLVVAVQRLSSMLQRVAYLRVLNNLKYWVVNEAAAPRP